MKKRILSIVLVLCMVMAFMPITVFADSNSHTVTVNAGEGGKVSTDGENWSDSVEVAVNDGETLDGKVQYKADEGYEFDGVVPKIVSVAGGGFHTVLLDSNGNVWTAGSNQFGQLGRRIIYNSNPIFTQITVGNGVKIKAIAAGAFHTVLLDKDGNVWTAGLNLYGQLGIDENKGTEDANPTFKQVTDGMGITAIAAGGSHTVLLDESNNVWTAGNNASGQLGRETNSYKNSTFTQVTDGISDVKIKAIAAGSAHTVLIDESNNVWTAGNNASGQLGRETSSDTDSTFTQATDGMGITAIATGTSHTVLLDVNGNVWTAGLNDCGQLGRDTSPDSYDPTFTKVTDGIGGVKITAIAAGQFHTVLLDENNNVWTAGKNDIGQLGRDTSPDSCDITFTKVTDGISGVTIKAIAAGGSHTVLLDKNNNVWTAGYNRYGQLGRDENKGTEDANPTFAQATVSPDAITFDELINIPIKFNSVFLVKFKDIKKPVITGLEKGKTYCDTVEFTVTDNDGIASVKANDVELTATNGKYTLEKGKGAVTVVAADNSGNTAEVTVTVNNGHTWNNGACSVCNYTCVHKDDSPKDHECDICGKTISGHTGGTATCTNKAVCEYCGEEYGKLDSSNHTGSKVWKTTETQHKQYWSCCDAVVVDYEDHTWNNGVCSVCGYPCSHDYDSVVTPPTCTESGYTTHTCANCGNSYVDSEVPATGHSFKFFKCVNCGMHYGCKGANCVFCSIVRWFNGLINSCEIWLTEAPVSIGKWFVGVFNCIVSAIE